MPNITQSEYNVVKQNKRILHTKIRILNFNLQTVGELIGNVIDEPSYNVDADSDIRRTCNISLIPTDSSFDIKYGSKLWIDKYVQIFIGIEDLKNNNEIVYTNLGIYLVNNPSQVYDSTTNTISISGVDMMAKLTGARSGNLEGIEYQVKAGRTIKGTLNAILKEQGITKINIASIKPANILQRDISISVGGTTYDLITQLKNETDNFQAYFDLNGTFCFNQIPSGKNEQIMVDDDLWKNVLIDYQVDISYEDIKNYIEVYGRTLSDGTIPHAKMIDYNPKSPFYVYGSAGIIRQVITDDNILTNHLAKQRAKYELYKQCKFYDQVQIKCVPIYWLDVNWVVELTLPNKQGIEKTELYMIKKIDTSLGGTQQITLVKYYPTYPF